nr:acyl-CoA dehydrogenase [Desulfobacterales bacterium]
MNPEFYGEEHRIFRETFNKFLQKEVVPNIDEWEREGIIPKETWRKMGCQGFLCPWLEERYGGVGAGFEYSVIITEELAYTGTHSLMAYLHSDIVAPYIDTYGSEAQKEKWLPACASGDIILSIAMTEPSTGSDLAAIRTRAVREGDYYIINGQKTFISNGINSNLVVVACRTGTDSVSTKKGISLICVEEDSPGFSRGRNLDKMGFCSQDTAELFFNDCRVPVANLLGKEGDGFYYMMEKLQQERLILTVLAQAMAEAMLDMTIRYCKERKAFGQPISSFQHNTFKIVDMATEIELGRTFLDSLIADHIAQKDIVKKVSMGKAWIAEMANRVAYQCVQLYGGYGYMEEYPICRFARDVRVTTIFGGTSEIMKRIVARIMDL